MNLLTVASITCSQERRKVNLSVKLDYICDAFECIQCSIPFLNSFPLACTGGIWPIFVHLNSISDIYFQFFTNPTPILSFCKKGNLNKKRKNCQLIQSMKNLRFKVYVVRTSFPISFFQIDGNFIGKINWKLFLLLFASVSLRWKTFVWKDV